MTYPGMIWHLLRTEARRAWPAAGLVALVLAYAIKGAAVHDEIGALMVAVTVGFAAAWCCAADAPGRAAPFFRTLPIPPHALLLARLLLVAALCVVLPLLVLSAWLALDGSPWPSTRAIVVHTATGLSMWIVLFVLLGSAARSTSALLLAVVGVPILLLMLRLVDALQDPLQIIARPWIALVACGAVLLWLYRRQRRRVDIAVAATIAGLVGTNAVFASAPRAKASRVAPVEATVGFEIDSTWVDVGKERLFVQWHVTDTAAATNYRVVAPRAFWLSGRDTVWALEDDRGWVERLRAMTLSAAGASSETGRRTGRAAGDVTAEVGTMALSEDAGAVPAPATELTRGGIASMLLPPRTRSVPPVVMFSGSLRHFRRSDTVTLAVGDRRQVAATGARFVLTDTVFERRHHLHVRWTKPAAGVMEDTPETQPLGRSTFVWISPRGDTLPLERTMHAWGGWPLIVPWAQLAEDRATLGLTNGAALPDNVSGHVRVARWRVVGDQRITPTPLARIDAARSAVP